MKVEKEFVMREIADDYVIIPIGATALEFSGLATVNEVGAFLWKLLQKEVTFEELVAKVLEEYEVDEKEAKADILEFLDTLKKHKILSQQFDCP